nr:hypothetical protein [Tanacetum cinerariifolium]
MNQNYFEPDPCYEPNSSSIDQFQPPQYSDVHQPSKEISIDELKIMMQSYFEQMNQQREQEALLAAQRKQELREQEEASQEKEKPPQNSDFRQLIGEVCGTKVCEEQKKNMENTMLGLLDICREKALICMHNNVDDLIESALNSKLLSINLKSQRLDKEKQEVKNIVEQPTKCITRITESLQNFRVIHKKSSISNTTISETKSDEIKNSNVENLVPILKEYEVTSNNESKCDVPVFEDSSFDALKDHSEILSDSNDVDISSDDDAFEDIEFVEVSLPDSKLVSLEESSSSFPIPVADSDSFFEKSDTSLSYSDNSLPEFETISNHTEEKRSGSTTAHANNSFPEYDSFQAVDLFLVLDNLIPPVIENIDYDSEGDIYFLEELFRNDSLSLPENESSNFDHHGDPSFPRPPPKPPDVEVVFDFKLDTGVLTDKVVEDISTHHVLMPKFLPS